MKPSQVCLPGTSGMDMRSVRVEEDKATNFGSARTCRAIKNQGCGDMGVATAKAEIQHRLYLRCTLVIAPTDSPHRLRCKQPDLGVSHRGGEVKALGLPRLLLHQLQDKAGVLHKIVRQAVEHAGKQDLKQKCC